MSRLSATKKKTAEFDPLGHSRIANMLVNRMMKHGKKSLAYQIFYRAAVYIKKKKKQNPILVLRKAVKRVTPRVGVKTLKKRKKGRSLRVPIGIPFEKGKLLALRWLLRASRRRLGTSMASKFRDELIDAAFKNRGRAIRKKENTYKMARSCKTNAHFRYKKKPWNRRRKKQQDTSYPFTPNWFRKIRTDDVHPGPSKEERGAAIGKKQQAAAPFTQSRTGAHRRPSK